MTKKTFAMLAAVPAIPPKPKIAATIATTRNVRAQFNMISLSKYQYPFTAVGPTIHVDCGPKHM
jgi:hypothetical protein